MAVFVAAAFRCGYQKALAVLAVILAGTV
ncbi:hypothetical protein CCACVL1_25511 [Corchorus capsularis]|uniref:Uncharacterized protein n=1 Tax=Corchorus capsularis TaxID=210143 RepID=A0A1R3GJM2_COCAP|nr:hypothetical protein CCACVL1_25511 [Corchorus capsularis]